MKLAPAGWVCVFAIAGCSGSIGDDTRADDEATDQGGESDDQDGPDDGRPGGRGGAGGGGGSGGLGDDPGDPKAVARAPLRRLTRTEYDNTVRDLLGDTTRPARAFPAEGRMAGGFLATGPASGVEVSRYQEAAQALAAEAVARRWSSLVPCTTADEGCAGNFIERFGAQAFRRPLTADEKSEHLALYRTLRATPIAYDHKAAIETLIAAMLQSPRFLYHWERAPGPVDVIDGAVRLGPYEVASRLSYLLWQSMPDADLFASAASGALLSADELGKQARRLLADPRAKDAIAAFFALVLDADRLETLAKDQAAYPTWSRALAQSMERETAAFTAWAVLEQGTLEALLTSSSSFVDETLAKLYGASGVTGTNLRAVPLDPERRFGLLTQGTFLAVQASTFETSPIKRGVVVLERFLCRQPPPVPDEIPALKPSRPNMQTREKFEEHTTDGACAACHKVMDPLGFAFESYDGIGAFRTTEAGRPVNTAGEVDLDGKPTAFTGARGLLTAMAGSREVERCAAAQWLRFALGRDVDDADQHTLVTTVAAFREKRRDLRELLAALVSSRSFLYRAPFEGEVR